MINRFLAWLKSIYFKPVVADNNTSEVQLMSEPIVDTAVGSASSDTVIANAVHAAGAGQSPVVEVKSGVADLDAALAFIESGVAQLGKAAKDELKALAKKYL